MRYHHANYAKRKEQNKFYAAKQIITKEECSPKKSTVLLLQQKLRLLTRKAGALQNNKFKSLKSNKLKIPENFMEQSEIKDKNSEEDTIRRPNRKNKTKKSFSIQEFSNIKFERPRQSQNIYGQKHNE